MKRHIILSLAILPTLLLAQSCPPGFLLQNPICCYASLPEACSYTSTGIVTCIYNPATTSSFVVPLGVTALTDLSLVGGVGGDGVDKSDIGGYNNHYMGGAATQISIPSFAVPPGEPLYVVVAGVGIGFIFDEDAGGSSGGSPGENGGGPTGPASGDTIGQSGGGGASDIRMTPPDGQPLTAGTDTRVIIAAGGGGGAFAAWAGGDGGLPGLNGANGQCVSTPGSGGTQTGPGPNGPPGALGVGGEGTEGSGSGGGGYWGGSGGQVNGFYGGGGGGSSFVPVNVDYTASVTRAQPTIQFSFNGCGVLAQVASGGPTRNRRRNVAPLGACPWPLKPCPLPSGAYECIDDFETCEL